MGTIADKLAALDEEGVLAEVNEKAGSGGDPIQLFDECREGMIVVGQKYGDGEYFVSDLMLAAHIFKQVTAILEPKLAGAEAESKGAIVFGTVAGDIHDIGKDLAVSMLRANGFEVHDLGVDVAPAAFVDKVQETGAKVLGLSGLLTVAFDAMKETVVAIEAAGLRSDVKIMVGGGPVDETVCEYTGADAWGNSAQTAVSQASQWMEA